MIGNPGRGKTHISIAIGLKACLQGYRVLFKNAGTLATELTEARDAYQLGRIEWQLEKTDLLVLDELSYMSFHFLRSDPDWAARHASWEAMYSITTNGVILRSRNCV